MKFLDLQWQQGSLQPELGEQSFDEGQARGILGPSPSPPP